jgi:catechol 2,3-dioxygenase
MSSAAELAPAKGASGFFRPRRLGHVNLYVGDVDRAMNFYNRILGIEEVYRTPLVGGGFLSNGNTHHDIGFTDANGPLGKPRGAKPGQLNHLGIELGTERELVDSFERATGAGHTFMRTADHDIAHSVYGRDPAGNVYELYADVVHDWRNKRTGMVTKPKPNWTPGSTPIVEEACYHVNPELRRVETAIFHSARVTHAAVVVEDLAATLDHYLTIVGMQVVARDPQGRFVLLGGEVGEHSLTFIQADDLLPPGYHHAGLHVQEPDDLAASVARARKDGIAIEADISHAGRRAVFLRDPEGFRIQVYSDENGTPSVDRIDPALAAFIL